MSEFREGWPKVEGCAQVVARLGGWPSFHDAEVRRLTLDCAIPDDAPTLELVVYVFQTLPMQVDREGYLVLHSQTLLTLRFTRVAQLQLEDFNHQNQLGALMLNDVSSQQWEQARFAVRIVGEFGVRAAFYCREIAVTGMEPVEAALAPPDGSVRVGRARPFPPPDSV